MCQHCNFWKLVNLSWLHFMRNFNMENKFGHKNLNPSHNYILYQLCNDSIMNLQSEASNQISNGRVCKFKPVLVLLQNAETQMEMNQIHGAVKKPQKSFLILLFPNTNPSLILQDASFLFKIVRTFLFGI